MKIIDKCPKCLILLNKELYSWTAYNSKDATRLNCNNCWFELVIFKDEIKAYLYKDSYIYLHARQYDDFSFSIINGIEVETKFVKIQEPTKQEFYKIAHQIHKHRNFM